MTTENQLRATTVEPNTRIPDPAGALAGKVGWITFAPVKGLALRALSQTNLGLHGVPGDRKFVVADDELRVVNGKRCGELAAIEPELDTNSANLTLRFPGGFELSADIRTGPKVDVDFWGVQRSGRLLEGSFNEALSGYVGQSVRLVQMDDGGQDRGPTVTFLSRSALRDLAVAVGSDEDLDHRRFRMTFGIDSVPPHAEREWVGSNIGVGEAVVEIVGMVGRCKVIDQDPDTGHTAEFRALQIIRQMSSKEDTKHKAPFGVWGQVVVGGRVNLGDPVLPHKGNS